MDVREQTVDTTTDDGEMALVIAEPADPPDGGGEWPVVLVFIDAPGVRPATREFMARLASNGYRVVTPDLHHRHGRLLHFEPGDVAADPSRGQTIRGWIASMTDDQIQHDANCALIAAGVDDESPFAAIGFCLGARGVYRAMQRNPERVVCGAGWHPSFLVDDTADSPHRTAAGLRTPLYLGIGEADKVQSIEMHQKFLDAVVANPLVDVTTFPGADHGFTWPGYPTYNENAAETSWTKTLAMLSTAHG